MALSLCFSKHDNVFICHSRGFHAGFIRRTTGRDYPPGDFVDQQGHVLGQHKGIIRYTIGQRKGLGLALPQPMYVMKKDLAKNQVVLGENEDLFTTTFEIEGCNWMPFDRLTGDLAVEAKVRYSQKASPATVIPLGEDRRRDPVARSGHSGR